MTKYSVIIPLYNKGWRIKRTIDSVLRQERNDLEIIVVDDGSTDDSADYVKAYQDDSIKYIYKKNGGVSSARNRGFLVSKGDWLLFLDADDELTENAIKIYEEMEKKYPQSLFFAGQNKLKGLTVQSPSLQFYNASSPFLHLWLVRVVPTLRNMLVARSLIERYGLFDERMSYFEDWEFALRMCRCGCITYTNRQTGIYNVEEGGLSRSTHPLHKEMAYYIPEILSKGDTTFWERALLYENSEQEIAWWQGHPKELAFYRDMQRRHFAWYHRHLHWLRQQLMRHGLI